MKSKAIVFSGVNKTEIVGFEQRQPKHDEVLIKVEFSRGRRGHTLAIDYG